jgi:hypothetical protein
MAIALQKAALDGFEKPLVGSRNIQKFQILAQETLLYAPRLPYCRPNEYPIETVNSGTKLRPYWSVRWGT